MRRSTVKSMIRQLEKARERIGAQRDELRKILDEVEALEESAGVADEHLQAAIDKLSEYA